MNNIHEIEERVLADVRALAAHHECRIEVSSDSGFVGKFCVTASDEGRSRQGFGPNVPYAVAKFRGKPVPK